MPIYEYRCENGHRFEVFQSMSDDLPVTECRECGAAVERVFTPIAIHFKGSGFYTTDYARKGAGKGASGGSKESESSSSLSSSADSSSSSSSDSKSSSEKASSSSSSGSGSSSSD